MTDQDRHIFDTDHLNTIARGVEEESITTKLDSYYEGQIKHVVGRMFCKAEKLARMGKMFMEFTVDSRLDNFVVKNIARRVNASRFECVGSFWVFTISWGTVECSEVLLRCYNMKKGQKMPCTLIVGTHTFDCIAQVNKDGFYIDGSRLTFDRQESDKFFFVSICGEFKVSFNANKIY